MIKFQLHCPFTWCKVELGWNGSPSGKKKVGDYLCIEKKNLILEVEWDFFGGGKGEVVSGMSYL